MVNRNARRKRDGSGQDADFDEYLDWEAQDTRKRYEEQAPGWADHGQPNDQGLYDIGWYADKIKPTLTDNTVNLGGNGRPLGHMKHFTSGTMAGGPVYVEKGERVPEASRGVGQPTVDGFINNNPMMERLKSMDPETRRKVLAAFIRSQILQKGQN